MVTLVCGAPGSGKTTYVHERMAWGDLVVDLDAIMAAISGQAWYDKPANLLPLALDIRDMLHRAIANGLENVSHVWVVSSEPDGDRRRKLAHELGATIVMLDVDATECLRRIASDERRKGRVGEWQSILSAWWKAYTA